MSVAKVACVMFFALSWERLCSLLNMVVETVECSAACCGCHGRIIGLPTVFAVVTVYVLGRYLDSSSLVFSAEQL